jgi:hypothetical protein
VLAGVTVPDTPLITRALDHAREVSQPYLFNHVVRSWLFAVKIGEAKGVRYDGEVVAAAALLHDLGLTAALATGTRRFEVEGADATRRFVRQLGFDERRTQLAWDAVALHSTPSLNQYKEPEVAIAAAGIGLDFGGAGYALVPAETVAAILQEYPRLAMKQQFTACCCALCRTKPDTTYGSFLRDFGERFVEGYQAPSSVDFLMNAPFDE